MAPQKQLKDMSPWSYLEPVGNNISIPQGNQTPYRKEEDIRFGLKYNWEWKT